MTLKVKTWNVENLFLPGTKYGPKTQDVYDAKLDGLAGVIHGQVRRTQIAIPGHGLSKRRYQ